MNLTIDVVEDEDKTIVLLDGELDILTAPELKNKLLKIVSQDNHKLEVDLENVSYMDSTGIGVFINAYKNAQKTNSSLELTNLQDKVLRLFKITGIDELIDIKSTSRGGK